MSSLSVVILTYNEEGHVGRSIGSIRELADDIVVVDSFSTDETVKIAQSLGARVFQHAWTNHATQFQWALDNTGISTDWVMRLDADEYLEGGGEELHEVLSSLPEETTGVNLKRKICFLGQWIKYGAIYPVYTLRIWRNGAGRIENRWMDEHVVLIRGAATTIDLDIVDDNGKSVSWWIDKHNMYATREVVDILNRKYHFMPCDDGLYAVEGSPARYKRFVKEKIYNKLPVFVRPALYFLYRYVLRLGFLDGTKGYAFHYMQGYWYRTLIDLKFLELEALIGDEKDPEIIKEIVSDFTGLRL